MSKLDRKTLSFACGATLALGAATFFLPGRSASAENVMLVPPPASDVPANGAAASETAVFAGGCFWGVQGVFQHVKGVTAAVSGYSGGSRMTASYPVVSTGETGHAEAVQVTFDPKQVSYGKLLRIYFSVVADPTMRDAQGPDEGTQYRSDLFATSPEQARVAKQYIEQLGRAHVFPAAIVTKVSTFQAFYPAESYHQDYLTRHPHNSYIATNDMPKVEALQRLFPDDYKQSPTLTAATE